MEKFQFERPDVAEKYECLVKGDQMIYMTGYSGKVSRIPLQIADQLAQKGHPFIKRKEATSTCTDQASTSPAGNHLQDEEEHTDN